MIKLMSIGKTNLRPGHFLPLLLDPLVSAARRGRQLLHQVKSVVANLSFDNFIDGVGSHAEFDWTQQVHAFTALPVDWVRKYEEEGDFECGPRLFLACNRRETIALGVQTDLVRAK